MLFSRRLPLAAIIQLCRSLRHNLGAGIMLRDVFRQQAKRGSPSVRPVADRIAQSLTEGDNLTTALLREKAAFPPLFLSLTEVGEESGNLPEVCGELEKYYLLQQRFWRQFISQCTLPILQFVAATGVISLLLVILGWIADANHTKPIDPLGLGLVGARGAVVFLFSIYGMLAAVGIAYVVLSRSLSQKAVVDRLLLRLPVVGSVPVGPLLEPLLHGASVDDGQLDANGGRPGFEPASDGERRVRLQEPVNSPVAHVRRRFDDGADRLRPSAGRVCQRHRGRRRRGSRARGDGEPGPVL